MTSKTAVPEAVFSSLWSKAEATGLFVPAGRELKCPINRKLSEEEILSLLDWCVAVAEAVREYGFKD